ncbi:30S ribosomal protein S17, chloroplastic [Neltuma alba]|uniref:30S ribosomal protein S17, chloroplastic n=1 Tax=Neltuma alba TaxID=207710 RepID=UPI0010A4A36C|nr:30S ribosomal protein S17, chloroplastic [Prosopis alba]
MAPLSSWVLFICFALSFCFGSIVPILNVTSATSSFTLPQALHPFLNGSSSLSKTAPPSPSKTVAVEVVRLAPHPKYKRRVRKKKKYQAHDPENQFKVGDLVQLEKSRPLSKTKTFVAVAVPPRGSKKDEASGEIGIPLESQQEQQPVA